MIVGARQAGPGFFFFITVDLLGFSCIAVSRVYPEERNKELRIQRAAVYVRVQQPGYFSSGNHSVMSSKAFQNLGTHGLQQQRTTPQTFHGTLRAVKSNQSLF